MTTAGPGCRPPTRPRSRSRSRSRATPAADAFVTVATVGPPAAEAALRDAVARGARRAVRVDAPTRPAQRRRCRRARTARRRVHVGAVRRLLARPRFGIGPGADRRPPRHRPGARSGRRRHRRRRAAPRVAPARRRSPRGVVGVVARRRVGRRIGRPAPAGVADRRARGPHGHHRGRRRTDGTAGDADRGGSVPAAGPGAPGADRRRRAHPDPGPDVVGCRRSRTARRSRSIHPRRPPGSCNRCASGATSPPSPRRCDHRCPERIGGARW